MRLIAANGDVLHQHEVSVGDIWRAASTRKAPIEDWVRLAIDRQKAEGCQAIFWLDASRPHDAELIKYVQPILEAAGVARKFQILAPREATGLSLETIRKGENTIAISGNVLRDYLTDLFPILELGTSAKMLSIVKLMNGGGMFLADLKGNDKARVLGKAVDVATQGVLDHDKSPKGRVGQTDNRDSHFYFALYWAQALAAQTDDGDLAAHFAPIAHALAANEAKIVQELGRDQGKAVDLGGYYHTDAAKTEAVMRPSKTFVDIIG